MMEGKEIELSVGVFGGILQPTGGLLIQRRKEPGSNIPGKSFLRDYELPGGGLTQEEMKQLRKTAAFWDLIESSSRAKDWFNHALPPELMPPLQTADVLIGALKREVAEETGLAIDPVNANYLTRTYRTILVQKNLAKIDIAICIPVEPEQWSGEPASDFEWASTKRIKELSEKPQGERIVSGWGKRMCQMMLWALCFSQSIAYREDAINYLLGIQKEKGQLVFTREMFSII